MENIAEEIKKALGPFAKEIPDDILASYSREISGQKTALSRCSAVEYLAIYTPGTPGITKVYVNKTRSHMLLVSPTPEQVEQVMHKCGSKLCRLLVKSSRIPELDVSDVRGLRELRLAECRRLAGIRNLELLTGLRVLDLSGTAMEGTLNLDPLEELTDLSIRETDISRIQLSAARTGMTRLDAGGSKIADAAFLAMLPNLKVLDLQSTRITGLPDDVNLQMLEKLELSDTAIQTLGGFRLPDSLKCLNLDSTEISTIPREVESLPNLEELGLSGLKLDGIPPWFPDFHLLAKKDAVILEGTRVAGELIVFQQDSPDEFREILRMYASNGQSEYKVILLGDAEAGKSLTLCRLLEDDKEAFEPEQNGDDDPKTYIPAGFDHNSTAGIQIADKTYDLNRYGMGNQQIRVHFWDFGGQEILHSAHSMFMTDNTLYVILLNTRNDTQDERAVYWLRFLQGLNLKNCPVILVLNKIDQNLNASVDENTLTFQYKNIRNVKRVSALKYNRRRFSEEITKTIISQLLSVDGLRVSFPLQYDSVRTYLESASTHWITSNQFIELCIQADGATDETGERYKKLRDKITHLGIGCYCEHTAKTGAYLILRPQWITNAIYSVFFNLHSQIHNGIIGKRELLELLDPPEYLRGKYQQVAPEEKYDENSVSYVVDVMQAMNLAFPMNNDRERFFIPMLCRRNTPDAVREYINNTQTLRFRYCYETFPKVIFFKLLADLCGGTEDREVWLTGARFTWSREKCSAVLQKQDHVLSLYVKGEELNSQEREKMHELIVKIGDLNEKFEVKNVTRQIGFWCPPQLEYHDYEALVNSRNQNNLWVFSNASNQLVPIDHILEFDSKKDDRIRSQLLENILEACGQLQDDYHYYDCKEDNRNVYLRNSLHNMGYLVFDQTQQGYGGGCSEGGRPDLKIQSKNGKLTTLLEAMNLDADNDASREKWNDHLNRLMVNYNQGGHPYLFLVCYVVDKAEEFGRICDGFFLHMQTQMPPNYRLEAYNPDGVYSEPLNQRHYIRKAHCTYENNGRHTMVYHIFVRIWKKPEPDAGKSDS